MTVLQHEELDNRRGSVGCFCFPSLVRLGKAVKRAFKRKSRKPLSVNASAGSGQSVFLCRLSSLKKTEVAKWRLPAAYACPPPYSIPTSLAPPHPPSTCTSRNPHKEAALFPESDYKEPLKPHALPRLPSLNLAQVASLDTVAKAAVEQEAENVETAPPPTASLPIASPTTVCLPTAIKITESKAEAVIQERSALQTKKGPDPPQKKLDALPPNPSQYVEDDYGTPKKSCSPTSPVSTKVVTLFQRYVRGGKMLNTAVKKPSKGPQRSASLFLEELESRSSRKKMIQEDAVTFREGLANLAKEIEEAKPKNMPQLVEFVQSADAYLDKLVDEHEVLKLVPWPDRFGLMREATKLFSDLMAIKAKLGTWRTSARSVEEELEAMEKFTRATVERMDLLQQKETTVAEKFTKAGLPWKVGVWKEVRSAALHLLAQYTTLVLQAANRDLSSSRSARILKGSIAFTYLVHAFVGGLCPRCTELFSTLVEVAQKCLPPLQ
ncbi:hypothetical protein BSKO_03965 [Bryopsis sp. KO-2023]|nr:hypothetical protein BSKO_03965 [Bryopsis sp. KO-2023]